MRSPDLKVVITKKNYSNFAILATSNAFSPEAGFLIRNGEDKDRAEVLITLKTPEDSAGEREEKARELFKRFEQALAENQVRYTLMKKNAAQRVQMLNHALTNPVLADEKSTGVEIPESIAKILEEDTGDESYLDDPLKIAVPWEDRT